MNEKQKINNKQLIINYLTHSNIMKKFFFLAAIASVALAGCTKNEPVRVDNPTRIGFTPISQRTATKAQIYGEQNATYTAGTSPAFEKFLAYASFTENNSTAPSGDFFPAAGVECEYQPTGYPTGSDFWAPADIYYWPKAGYLTFHAFSPSALTPYAGTVANSWTNGITITGFTASTNMDQQVDVLYSDFNAYQQRSLYNPETGFTYDDKTGDDDSQWAHEGVNLTFHHALSAVQFRVVTDQDYTAGAQKHYFTVTKIEVLDANNQGEFHENRTGVDNTYGTAAAGSVTMNKDNSLATSPYWVPTATAVTDYTVFSGTKDVLNLTASNAATDKEFGLYGKLMLPMPQLLGGHGASSDKDVVVKVTYNYKYNDGSDHTYNDLTTEISLAGKKAQKYNGTAEEYTVNQWLINHKYFYTLVFKLDPIIFDPKVDVWVNVEDINIDLPYQN